MPRSHARSRIDRAPVSVIGWKRLPMAAQPRPRPGRLGSARSATSLAQSPVSHTAIDLDGGARDRVSIAGEQVLEGRGDLFGGDEPAGGLTSLKGPALGFGVGGGGQEPLHPWGVDRARRNGVYSERS